MKKAVQFVFLAAIVVVPIQVYFSHVLHVDFATSGIMLKRLLTVFVICVVGGGLKISGLPIPYKLLCALLVMGCFWASFPAMDKWGEAAKFALARNYPDPAGAPTPWYTNGWLRAGGLVLSGYIGTIIGEWFDGKIEKSLGE